MSSYDGRFDYVERDLGRVGVVGRWKPFHVGGAAMLESLCEQADHVVIGLGSQNKHNLRNPFTADESRGMIDAFLSKRFDNYSFIYLDDFAHIPEYSDGQMWKRQVLEQYGELDHFVSGNDYVSNLLKEDYNIIHPATTIPLERRVRAKGTQARVEMAKGDGWRELVPEETAKYIDNNNLIDRFRREFGLQTIAEHAFHDYVRHESLDEEYAHTLEV